MPPKRKIAAPAGRIYKSSLPLKQTTFQEPKKRITSYGKATSKRVPKPDNTLTQMDYVVLNRPFDEENEEEEEEEDQELYEAEFAIPKKSRRKARAVEDEKDGCANEAEKRKRMRRKTTGDDLEEPMPKKDNKRRRRTLGDTPRSSSNFHTQTLPQINSWSSRSESPSVPQEEGSSMFDVPTTSQMAKQRRQTATKTSKSVAPQPGPSPEEPTESMPPPRTPRRRLGSEIPSSQSPATPFSLHSPSSSRRRTPLRDKSMNTPIPFSVSPKASAKKTPKLVVRDTFSTDSQMSRNPTSPARKSSPPKSVRFAEPEGEEVDEFGSHDSVDGSNQVDEQIPMNEQGHMDDENQDSERRELDEQEAASPKVKSEPAPTQPGFQESFSQRSRRNEILDSDAESDANDEDFKQEPEEEDDSELSEEEADEEMQEPETYYGDIGHETQIAVEELISSQELSDDEQESQVAAARKRMQSQRISLTQADLMAPRTKQSDIFISLHPPHVRSIRKRTKDHEFRKWSIPPTVHRLWIYETTPTSKVQYMVAISPAKHPGEIEDERGVGNAEFNAMPADSSEYAYEILGLYELANPLTMADLRAKEWLKGPPQRMAWVKPTVLDDLMGNLRPAIFTKPVPGNFPDSLSTDTQEAEAQLMSTIQQFTQPAPSEHSGTTPILRHDDISSSTLPAPAQYDAAHNISPSQAETVDLSQAGTPRHHHHLPEVIMESPTRPVHYNTPQLPPSTARSGRSDSVVPFSMASSQLLTKSQMLPDSLVNESVPRPPDFIMDSDEESE
jgi:hypothetical protein